MTIEVLEAFLSKNKIYLKEPEKLMELREKAFGTLAEDKLFLSPYETFYLVEKRRVRGRLRLRNLRKRSDPTTSINRLRRRRIHPRKTREALRKSEQGRQRPSPRSNRQT